MPKPKVSWVVLAPGDSVSQFVIGQIAEGLEVEVTVDNKAYVGWVCRIDIVRGANHVDADVRIPDLDGKDPMVVRVNVYRNGRIIVFPEDA